MTTSSLSRDQQISHAQSRLLALLDGAAPSASVEVAAPTQSECPKCATPSFDGGTWCSGCGYFPKAGYEGEEPVVEQTEEHEIDVWNLIPTWCWLMIGVDVLLIVGSVCFSMSIGEHWARTVVSAALLVFCTVLAVISHSRAYFRTLSSIHSLGTFDIVTKPSTIWRETLRGLPESSFLVSSLVWGVTGMMLSIFVIGGLDYMSFHQLVAREKTESTPCACDIGSPNIEGSGAPNSGKRATGMQAMIGTLSSAAGAAAGDGGAKDLEGALGEFAGPGDGDQGSGASSPSDESSESDSTDETEESGEQNNANTTGGGGETANQSGESESTDSETAGDGHADEEPASPTEEESDDTSTSHSLLEQLPPGEVVTCAIVGYTVNSSGEPRSLLLAAPMAGDWHYVTRLSISEIPPETLRELTSQFPSHRSPRPLVTCPFGGQWLTPDFFCEIHFPYSGSGLRFAEPTFVGLKNPNLTSRR